MMVLDACTDLLSETRRGRRAAMKHIPSVVIAWLLAAAVAACLASHNLYGQNAPNRPDPKHVWREAAVRGLSYNESLALYRLRQHSTVPTPLHPRFRAGAGAGIHTPGGASRQGTSFVPSFPSNVYSQRAGKPFDHVRPAPTAFERYWPLMLEGHEDPRTGVIIWSLP
jgi:hypothetical protein